MQALVSANPSLAARYRLRQQLARAGLPQVLAALREGAAMEDGGTDCGGEDTARLVEALDVWRQGEEQDERAVAAVDDAEELVALVTARLEAAVGAASEETKLLPKMLRYMLEMDEDRLLEVHAFFVVFILHALARSLPFLGTHLSPRNVCKCGYVSTCICELVHECIPTHGTRTAHAADGGIGANSVAFAVPLCRSRRLFRRRLFRLAFSSWKHGYF